MFDPNEEVSDETKSARRRQLMREQDRKDPPKWPPIQLDQPMPFGKYEGYTPEELAEHERGCKYLRWCFLHLDDITFSDQIHQEVNRAETLIYDEAETQMPDPALI